MSVTDGFPTTAYLFTVSIYSGSMQQFTGRRDPSSPFTLERFPPLVSERYMIAVGYPLSHPHPRSLSNLIAVRMVPGRVRSVS